MMSVKRGASEFSIPAIELGTTVCAVVNKNAGIPFPSRPVAKMNFH